MINFRGKNYKLYYLDTCALSEMVKDRSGFGSNLLNSVFEDGLMAISSHTLWELKSAPTIYNAVLNVISLLNTVLLKSEAMLFEDEYSNFENNSDSIHSPLACDLLVSEFTKAGISIESEITNEKNELFLTNRNDTFKILAKKPSNIYLAEDLKTSSIITNSVEYEALQLAAHYKFEEIRNYVETGQIPFPVKKFSSLMAISYIHHYKYLQSERKGLESDIQDILMAALYPYVDVVITESNQCEIIKQIKKRHNFLNNLSIISMRQVKMNTY